MTGVPRPCHCPIVELCIDDILLKPFYFCQGAERLDAEQLPGVDSEDWEDE